MDSESDSDLESGSHQADEGADEVDDRDEVECCGQTLREAHQMRMAMKLQASISDGKISAESNAVRGLSRSLRPRSSPSLLTTQRREGLSARVGRSLDGPSGEILLALCRQFSLWTRNPFTILSAGVFSFVR